MARKKDDTIKKLAIAALIGYAVYQFTKKPQQGPAYTNFSQIPPAPPANTQQWQQWVATVVQSFGAVANLWAPGGPFYQQPVTPEQAQQIQFGWDNALFTGGGFGMP